jgi:hypothetical protein
MTAGTDQRAHPGHDHDQGILPALERAWERKADEVMLLTRAHYELQEAVGAHRALLLHTTPSRLEDRLSSAYRDLERIGGLLDLPGTALNRRDR